MKYLFTFDFFERFHFITFLRFCNLKNKDTRLRMKMLYFNFLRVGRFLFLSKFSSVILNKYIFLENIMLCFFFDFIYLFRRYFYLYVENIFFFFFTIFCLLWNLWITDARIGTNIFYFIFQRIEIFLFWSKFLICVILKRYISQKNVVMCFFYDFFYTKSNFFSFWIY